MRSILLRFGCWLPVVCVPAYLFVDAMQDAGLFDNIGIWYTVYCTLGFAVPFAAFFAYFGKGVFSDGDGLRR